MMLAAYSENFSSQAFTLIGILSERLMARGMMLGMAESCTGGLASFLCTEVPGSSAWFAGGAVTYANAVKTSLLGVPEEVLKGHGAVSKEVVERMALGALRALNSQVGIAISGVAGPGGGTPDKPVGSVWIAVAAQLCKAEEATFVNARSYHFPGSRQEVRAAAVLQALGDAVRIFEG